MAVLQARGLWKAYPDKEGKNARVVLKDVDIEIGENEFVCIIGPSGCGKTTLLNIFAGFETAQKGDVLYRGDDISGPSSKRAVVFQEYSLLPWLTVRENVAFSISRKYDKNQRLGLAEKYIRLVGLEEFSEYRPNDLSGGMKQRVALARTLAMEPDVLLMDEPFSSLDERTRGKLDEELLRIWEGQKRTVLFVTHNIDEALRIATRVIMLPAAPGGIAGEWSLPKGPRDLSSHAMAQIKADINDRFQTCACIRRTVQIVNVIQ